MRFIRYYLWGIVISLLFFLVGLFTLSDYGVNIDESIHFERGHAYLNFFLTGKQKYSSENFQSPRSSEWKYRGYDTAYFMKNDSGHPPLNGILAAATNLVLHEKLGIIGDLESYHLFELLVSTLLVFLVYCMTRSKWGVFAGIVASLSMSLYPLFYGESHYNIKDPIEASFFSFTLYFFYLGLEKIRARYFFLSSIFCGLAFGTKFNIVFLPFIIAFYLIIKSFSNLKKYKLQILKRIPKDIYVCMLSYPLIVFGIHFLTRPFLWPDPINRFLQIVQFYKDIGTGIDYELRFVKYGWNTYPLIFTTISTPLIILILFVIGIIVIIFKEKDNFSRLLLIWFSIVILRVSLPGTSIYGGVRQIMEYIPPMAIIAGIGALYLRKIIVKITKNNLLVSVIIILGFVPLVITLYKYHPNENIFINSLVGGLKGATEKKIPGTGETMGNAYLQGIIWLNDNAEKNAHFGFPVGLGSNFPPQFVRKDIKFGGVFSGERRDGEYMMEMYSVDFPFSRYTIDYLNRFLTPVHIIKVDDVPILKIWKNDFNHTRPGFIQETEEEIVLEKKDDSIYAKLKKPAFVTRIEVNYDNKNCTQDTGGDYSYSPDGNKEFRYPDDSPLFQGKYVGSLQKDNKLVYFFPAVEAEWIHVSPHDTSACLLKTNSVKVFSLKDIRP